MSNENPPWTVGEVVVHRIDETSLPLATGAWLLPEATADVVAQQEWLRPDFASADGLLRIDSHSFAFTAGGTRVIVDTGIGNGKTRANPAWHDLRTGYLERLTAAGFPPESVDLVVLTHLHADHVGWNTVFRGGEWVPTFPNARYVTSHAEREFWSGYDMDESRARMFRDSVRPVEDAGLLDLVDAPVEIAPGVRLLSTPGHTPGHLAVEVRSGGETAVITGDCAHHPVQFADPAITSCVDIDPSQAEVTRRHLLASLAGTGTLVLGTHFAPPTAGTIVAHRNGYRMNPAGKPN
ncbi:MBL fold metallo-hydrolase [Parasphingorhabdus pacifica]